MKKNNQIIEKIEKIKEIKPLREDLPVKEISPKRLKKIIDKVGVLNTILMLRFFNLPTSGLLSSSKILDQYVEEIKSLTDSIKQSKDWKSKSYLLDKLTEARTKTTTNLMGLKIVVNRDGHQSSKDTQVGGENI